MRFVARWGRASSSTLARWPRLALVLTAALGGLLVVVSLLWLLGTRPYGGPFDSDAVGSVGDWVAGGGALIAVLVTVRQFRETRRAESDHEERAEAMKVVAWAEWALPPDGPAAQVGRGAGRWPRWWRGSRAAGAPSSRSDRTKVVTVLNGSQGALFDWNVTVVPSERGWSQYVRLSSRMGQLAPGERIAVRVDDPLPGATVLRFAKLDHGAGTPRFVVVAFTDAWGGGWVRVNGDLQKVPRESHFVPRLVHLRNPAMPWAGMLDQADWSAFWEAAGGPGDLPLELEELVGRDGTGWPWLGPIGRAQVGGKVAAQTLRRRGVLHYVNEERAVRRKVQRAGAFRRTQAFFKAVNASKKGEVLFLQER